MKVRSWVFNLDLILRLSKTQLILPVVNYLSLTISHLFIPIGGRVEVQVCGLTWDGSTTEAKCFSRGMLSFTAGAKQVTIGLDSGIRRLRVGDKAAIVCAPYQAYGEPGNPPTVLPNSYIVYFVYVLSCSDADRENPVAVGPSELCGPGITTKFEDVINEGYQGKSVGQVLTDDMLSRAAASMGINAPPPPPPLSTNARR